MLYQLPMTSKTIVFYDGDCGFCNSIVELLLKYENGSSIFYCSLQSNLAYDLLIEKYHQPIDFSTFYLLKDEQVHTKSSGFFIVLKYMNWKIRWLRFFRFLPTFLTDVVYDFIAKRRRNIINNRCYVPTVEQRERFLK